MIEKKINTCSRREALKGISAVIGAIYFGRPSSASAEISMPEIRRLMSRNTVNDILQKEYDDGVIKKIEYNNEKGETNFDELVFQKNLNPEERKPVLILFYGSPGDANSKYEKREAIIFKELSKHYKGQLSFVSYNVKETKNIIGNIREIWKEITRKHGINASPSMAMYSTFDLAIQESPHSNDGRIKQIDILRGGPDEDWRINKDWLPFLKDKWIATNLTSLNNQYAWRFNNSGRKNRAFYSIRLPKYAI